MNMAEKIRMYRKRVNLTQEELAEMVGVSLMTAKRWEWGERIPNAFFVPKLASALGTTVGVLMGEVEPDAPEEKESAKNLPINNAPENENKIGMAYWGGIIDNAQKVAARGDPKELSLVAALLQSAMDTIKGGEINSPSVTQAVMVNGTNNKLTDFMNKKIST